MISTILGLRIDFERLIVQRMSPHYRGTPHPWLALGYVVLQALAALIPSALPNVYRIHEGLTRDLIGRDPSRRTGRYGWADDRPTLFIVPGPYTREPDARSRIWMLRGCGIQTCWAVLADLWRIWQLGHHPVVAELLYRALPYVELFQTLDPLEYVTTNISQFPESPAVPVANALGLKTIMWMYGDQHVLPTTSDPQGWTVPAAIAPAISEVHVWTDTAKWLWELNRCGVPPEPRIIVDGPRMLGKKPENFPQSRTIGIADTPAKRDASRFGIFTPAWVEAFYRDCYRAVSTHPDVSVLVKSKYADHLVASSNYKLYLCCLSQASELDPDSNPWTLIERCGLLICLPYSSMGVAALSVGREVIFYDPTGVADWYPDAKLRSLRIVGLEALQARLMAWKLQTEAVWSTLPTQGASHDPHPPHGVASVV